MKNQKNISAESEELTTANVGERLLSVKEAAEFLNVSRMSVMRRIEEGVLKSFKTGGKRRFSKERHLIPYLKSCEE